MGCQVFKGGIKKKYIFLAKNQHNQRKLHGRSEHSHPIPSGSAGPEKEREWSRKSENS